jgi:undecaprenyl-diphosphatase
MIPRRLFSMYHWIGFYGGKMNPLKALVLGLVQGIAEFLPISSSGHLELAKTIFGLEEVPILFDVILHVATLIVVVVVFKKRLLAILEALWDFLFHRHKTPSKGLTKTQKKKDEIHRENLAFVVPLLIATAVTAVIGIGIEKFIPSDGTKMVSIRMLITAIILGLTSIIKPGSRQPGTMGNGRAAILGLAQGIGVFSGISRSGITISAGIFAGLTREAAGEFSFLLSIPAILGALLLKLKDFGELTAAVSFSHLALAFFAAMIAGFAALKILLKIVKSGKLYWFAPYLLVVGVVGLLIG